MDSVYNGDLELLPNTLGARNDLVVVLTHPSAGSITGDISAYLTAAQRDGTTSQATITARDTVAQTEWGRAVSDDSDALSITLSSASSGPSAPPTPTTSSGFRLGGKTITKAYLGETEIERAYLGDTLIFGDPPSSNPPTITVDSTTRLSSIWSDGTTMWVSDPGANKLLAYTLATGSRDTTKEFNLASVNDGASGIWSDGTTMWVGNDDPRMVYAYTLATGARDTNKEFTPIVSPDDLGSDGTTMWIQQSDDRVAQAHTLATGARDSSKDITLDSDNGRAAGLWVDSTTAYVGDFSDEKLFAYRLSNGSRDSSKDMDLDGRINRNPAALWSDGTTMWVLDWQDFKIYPYNLANGTPLFPTT